MTTAISSADIDALKTCTQNFINHVYFVQHQFNLIPAKDHHGVCINYVDRKEFRDEFCTELITTISEWVYSQEKAKKIIDDFQKEEGRSFQNAIQAFNQHTLKKFRDRDSRKIFLQGQFGELLLFNFLQHFFSAIPLLRKMPIKTSSRMEVNGADAIHYNYESGKNLLYLGEAKSYTSKYSFSAAFGDALESIVNTYDTHLNELELYIYDGFIEDNLIKIAQDYKNGILKNVEVHLVSIIAYHEQGKLKLTNEMEIKQQIMDMIAEKGKALDKKIFNKIPEEFHPRFNYIIMPIWEMDKLLIAFQKRVGK
ncbi:MAG: DUF1837 domain-containing protein [Chitinophagaceae bacterium]